MLLLKVSKHSSNCVFSDNNDDSLFSQMSLGELAGIQVSDMESSYDVSYILAYRQNRNCCWIA